jgi:methanogenic corrinoid protein MtbC1
MSDYQDLEEAILNGQDEEAALLTSKLVSSKSDLSQINQSISNGIVKASENWTQGSFSSANILLSIDAYRQVKEILNGSNLVIDAKPIGRVIIATIAGNVHIIGKVLIGALLEASGFEVIDLGVNITRSMFKDKITELKPDILALGCYTLAGQQELKQLLIEIKEAGLKTNLKVIIGGHSTSQELASQIEADAWAANLPDTVEKAKKLVGINE